MAAICFHCLEDCSSLGQRAAVYERDDRIETEPPGVGVEGQHAISCGQFFHGSRYTGLKADRCLAREAAAVARRY